MVVQEEKIVKREVERVYERVEAATVKWRKVEDQALDKLGEQTAATKAARNLRRTVAHNRTKCRALVSYVIYYAREFSPQLWFLLCWCA